MKDYDQVVLKKTMNNLGTVKIGKKNITVVPAKQGHFNTANDHTFMKAAKWMKEPYNRAEKLEQVTTSSKSLTSFCLGKIG